MLPCCGVKTSGEQCPPRGGFRPVGPGAGGSADRVGEPGLAVAWAASFGCRDLTQGPASRNGKRALLKKQHTTSRLDAHRLRSEDLWRAMSAGRVIRANGGLGRVAPPGASGGPMCLGDARWAPVPTRRGLFEWCCEPRAAKNAAHKLCARCAQGAGPKETAGPRKTPAEKDGRIVSGVRSGAREGGRGTCAAKKAAHKPSARCSDAAE